jgi:hypothetical protein
MVESGIKQGQISAEEYVKMLHGIQYKDQLLGKYFAHFKQDPKFHKKL